ncbi:hypothetical protein DPSP01_001856 [Paraphaeosphaeria sporulosa]
MPHVLLLGLDPLSPPPGASVPPHVLASIAEKIAIDIARAARSGFFITSHYLDWRSPSTAFAALEKTLVDGPSAEGAEGWDAVMIGQGLRMWKDPELFEGAVGVLRRVCEPARVKVLFNDGADRQCATLERGFGVKMGE